MKITICVALWLIVISAMLFPAPSAKSGEMIAPEIIEYPCLSWEQHKEKYPRIQGEHLVSAMLSECAR